MKYDACLVVPSSAVTTTGAEQTVFVKQEEDFVPRLVQIARDQQGMSIITEGIEEGEVIALHNPFEVRRLHLPDFGKATVIMQPATPPGRGRHH